ncbi:hypothetical protein [Microbacterium sp.]|nr:hypothetical protein [Microbacterium sp.]HWK76951.1 hypothetical protein [Microbacterium sp.]
MTAARSRTVSPISALTPSGSESTYENRLRAAGARQSKTPAS